jgi:hypothetical protein
MTLPSAAPEMAPVIEAMVSVSPPRKMAASTAFSYEPGLVRK